MYKGLEGYISYWESTSLKRLDPDRSHLVRFNTIFPPRWDEICVILQLLRVDLRTPIDEVHVSSRRRGLALPLVRSIARPLVTALDFLEVVGVVRGDVKPVNRHEQPTLDVCGT